jgi:hypothetical protein
VTRSQLRLQGQANQQQRARIQQRAAAVTAPGRANAPPVPPRELHLARLEQRLAPVNAELPLVFTLELVLLRISRLQTELTQHQAHLCRLETAPPRDPEAGIANPPTPYTPPQQLWNNTVGL